MADVDENFCIFLARSQLLLLLISCIYSLTMHVVQKRPFVPNISTSEVPFPWRGAEPPSPLFPFFMFSSSNYTELQYTVFCSEHCDDLYDFLKKPQKTKNPSTPQSPPVRLWFGDWECACVVFLQLCCILYLKLHTMKLSAVKIHGHLFYLKRLDFWKLCLAIPINVSLSFPIVCSNFQFLSWALPPCPPVTHSSGHRTWATGCYFSSLGAWNC